MAQRRWLQTVARHTLPLISSKPTSSLKPLPHLLAPNFSQIPSLSQTPFNNFYTLISPCSTLAVSLQIRATTAKNEEDDGEEGEEEEEDYDSDNNEAEGG
ncbi:hypothetical protein OIU77_007519 [Salix suchowensis]|uniref:Uncharacterized protein n=1 Tax=Salix suchowensis TaxID=1278906 RepID=A0ABQ9AH82_9ROSI|nr:hypothetical protein OIU77_007519 [Salix suchowensis]